MNPVIFYVALGLGFVHYAGQPIVKGVRAFNHKAVAVAKATPGKAVAVAKATPDKAKKTGNHVFHDVVHLVTLGKK